jgi:hypothetical protein
MNTQTFQAVGTTSYANVGEEELAWFTDLSGSDVEWDTKTSTAKVHRDEPWIAITVVIAILGTETSPALPVFCANWIPGEHEIGTL